MLNYFWYTTKLKKKKKKTSFFIQKINKAILQG